MTKRFPEITVPLENKYQAPVKIVMDTLALMRNAGVDWEKRQEFIREMMSAENDAQAQEVIERWVTVK